MILYLGLFVLLCLYGIKIYTAKDSMADYLSVGKTQSIKGIFIILVFFSHFNSYVQLTDRLDLVYKSFIDLFGQTMVTLFLFYSGYGIMESIRKKGNAYIRQLPVKRILATIFRFDCAVLLFAAVSLAFGERITLTRLLLSLVGWESVGNSNWYIFVILLLYFLTFVVFSLFGKYGNNVCVIAVLAFVGLYVFFFDYWGIKPVYWYNTALCYVLGMFYSLVRKRIEQIINKNLCIYLLTLIAFAGAFLALLKFSELPGAGFLVYLFFAATVVVATMRISLDNCVLRYFGKNLFELYILQRLPMMIFLKLGMEVHIEVYFALCVISTILLAVPFKQITGKICGKICRG